MLHVNAVDPSTLDLLKRLLQVPQFKAMRLAGGTSLALQLGHRKSIGIDLFGTLEADRLTVVAALQEFDKVTIIQQSENIGIYSIEGIKVDIVNYHYPWLLPPVEETDIRMARMEDIAAMKLSAITGRGSKKDFIDIYFLLQSFSLKEMIGFYSRKYSDGSEFLVMKSLTYFEDADPEPEPVLLVRLSWEEIKQFIVKQINSEI